MPDGRSGYLVDASGAMYRVAFGGAPRPPRTRGNFVTPGQPVTRGVALLPDGTGGYTIDVQGGIHPFAVGPTNPIAPPTSGVTRFPHSSAGGDESDQTLVTHFRETPKLYICIVSGFPGIRRDVGMPAATSEPQRSGGEPRGSEPKRHALYRDGERTSNQ